MKHTDALAQIYARSLYELAEAAGGQEKIVEIEDELEQICELARADQVFREFLTSPIIDVKRRAEAMHRIFNDRITDLALRFLLVLNAKGRAGHLESISTGYSQLVQAAQGRVEVDLYTPGPLGDEQVQSIKQRIQQAIGKEPVLHRFTDPDMLGGLKLRIGDQLIDGSVATRIRRMRQNLMSSGSTDLRESFDRIVDGGDQI
ncbi:MAG: ATP synthase F1 subunit delta [Planctomycetota bacterium]|nr:ATP synthase F1 subunit delta [Planctomycetota bacterium]